MCSASSGLSNRAVRRLIALIEMPHRLPIFSQIVEHFADGEMEEYPVGIADAALSSSASIRSSRGRSASVHPFASTAAKCALTGSGLDGDPRQAKALLRQAIALDPASDGLHKVLGDRSGRNVWPGSRLGEAL